MRISMTAVDSNRY